MQPYIIITAPHSKCVNVLERTCDLVAGKASEYLYEIVHQQYPNVVSLHSSNIYRSEDQCDNEYCDLNRPWAICRTNYWSTLAKNIKEVRGKYNPIFLIDVHSYPATESETKDLDVYLLNTTQFKYGSKELSHYIKRNINSLSGGGGNDKIMLQYVKDLNNILEENSIKRKILIGTDDNAINVIGSSNGFITILIEFNENLRDSRIEEICHIILQWIEEEIEWNTMITEYPNFDCY